jgi:two-component system response regulator YesN
MFKNVIFEMMRLIIQGDKGSKAVDSALEYIHNHYTEDIDNESVARYVGYHSYHLNRLIKTATGTTLRQYIINHRVGVAKRYLEQTDIAVCDISELCGYKNLSNFSIDFKKKTGISPSQYRAKCNRKQKPV